MTIKQEILKRLLESKIITYEEMVVLSESEIKYINYCDCNKYHYNISTL